MNIVIPTYNRHYDYNINFLNSFNNFCLDKNDVIINFIINSEEFDLFKNLKNEFINLNINIIKLNDLLRLVDNKNYSDSLNAFNNKYSLQSMKKLLAYNIVDTDYIVLDSENLCLKEFYFKDIFNTLKNKKLLYCNKIYDDIQNEVTLNCNNLIEFLNTKWFFVKSYWFYEKKIVNQLILHLKEIHNSDITTLLSDKTFFEYQLYCTFLLKNNIKETVCCDAIYDKEYSFRVNLDKIKANYEYIASILNEENVEHYINILNELDERIVRLHWMSESVKNKIIKKTNVCIGTFHWDQ